MITTKGKFKKFTIYYNRCTLCVDADCKAHTFLKLWGNELNFTIYDIAIELFSKVIRVLLWFCFTSLCDWLKKSRTTLSTNQK